jgi:hypothetical protein
LGVDSAGSLAGDDSNGSNSMSSENSRPMLARIAATARPTRSETAKKPTIPSRIQTQIDIVPPIGTGELIEGSFDSSIDDPINAHAEPQHSREQLALPPRGTRSRWLASPAEKLLVDPVYFSPTA